MSEPPEPYNFAALDARHQQFQLHLVELAILAQRLAATGSDEIAQRQADVIEKYFSGHLRPHHAEEEQNVFPLLLRDSDHELADTVRNLQHEHVRIEEDWRSLAQLLRAIASGDKRFDSAEFSHSVEAFLALSHNHLAMEEILVYPESKALWAKVATDQVKGDS